MRIINIHEIRNHNNKTIENSNICYLSQQLHSTTLTDIIIMSINSKVLHFGHQGQHQFIVARNSISSSPWKMKLSAGMFAGSRTMSVVGHSCTGIFSADGKQGREGISLSAFCLKTRSYDLLVFLQTSPSLAFLIVVRTVSSVKNVLQSPLVYFSFSLK